MSETKNGSPLKRYDIYIIALFLCLTAVLVSIISGDAERSVGRNLSGVSVEQNERRWQLLNEYNDGWTLLDSETGKICAVPKIGTGQCWEPSKKSF